MKQFVPGTTVFVWDEKKDYKPNIRKELYKEYKGNRSKNPSQIIARIKRMFSRLQPDSMEGNYLRGFLTAVNKRLK